MSLRQKYSLRSNCLELDPDAMDLLDADTPRFGFGGCSLEGPNFGSLDALHGERLEQPKKSGDDARP